MPTKPLSKLCQIFHFQPYQHANLTDTLPAIDGSSLTGISAL